MAESGDGGESSIPFWQQANFTSGVEIRAHPLFHAAHDRLVDELQSLYGDDRRLIRGLMDFVRGVSFMVIVCLDAIYDVEDPATFVTMARLRIALASMGITDRRRISDIVEALELDGFLTREVSPRDRRTHLLKPTEKMLATDREWLAAFHAPLALLYPDEPAYRAGVARDPFYQAAYRRISMTTLPFADKMSRDNPEIGYFLGQSVGIRILMVLASMVRGKSPARTPAGFYTIAADRAAVSRTHVRNVMRGAADLGLVALSSPAGQYVEMLPVLEQALSQWIADSLSGINFVALLAGAELEASNAAVLNEKADLPSIAIQ